METKERACVTVADVQHRAVLLADMIKVDDHLMTESDAPKSVKDLSVSLVMAARDMADELVNEIDRLPRVAR